MSIQRMRRRFAVHLRIVLYVLTGVFIIGLPLVFVPGTFRGRSREEQGRGTAQEEIIARVDGKSLTRSQLERHFDVLLAQLLPIYASLGQSVKLEGIWQWRLSALEQAIAEELLARQAEVERISVSGGEMKEYANQSAEQQLSRLKATFGPEELETRLAQVVAQTEGTARDRQASFARVSEEWFRRWMVKRLLKSAAGGVRRDLLLQKLRQKVLGPVSVTEQDLRASYDRVTVRQLEVSLRPEDKPKRTEEEARKRATELAARARRGEDFVKLVRAESDDPQASRTGGLLESVGRGMMPAEWEKAVFRLMPDEISDPIKLPSLRPSSGQGGYVIVKMEKLERKLPEDFEKKKKELMANFAQQKQNAAWQEYQSKLLEKAQVEVVDPEMRAWQALQQGNEKQTLSELQEAAAVAREREGLGPAVVFYQLATLLAARGQWQAAEEAYALSHDALAREERQLPGMRAQALVGMARCYERLGKMEDALLWYQAASDASDAPSVHQDLRAAYQKLGKKDLVAHEQQWLDNYSQAQLERQKMLESQRKASGEPARPAPTQPSQRPAGGGPTP